MQFLVSSTSLLKQISIASTVISNSSSMPILENFLFTIKEDELIISATDLETSIEISLEVQAKSEGIIAVPAKMLLDTLKNFPEQPLTFFVNKERNLVEISSMQGQYELAFLDGRDFPEIPKVESEDVINIPAQPLLSAYNHTLFATGNDDLRPIMTGVYSEFSPNGTTFVATNAHKLVRYKREDITSTAEAAFTLPKKPINVLKSILSNKEEEITFTYNANNAFFELENIRLTCRFIEGKFPNYNAVIPQDNPNKLYIDRATLVNSVKRVAVFSNKTTNQVEFALTNNMLELKAEDLDFSNKADEKIQCQFDGDFNIAFDSKFLLELLQNIASDEIVIEMSQPSRAGIIRPAGEQEDTNEDILMLIMPIMV